MLAQNSEPRFVGHEANLLTRLTNLSDCHYHTELLGQKSVRFVLPTKATKRQQVGFLTIARTT